MTDQVATLQKALDAIKKLKQMARNQIVQPIAIIGLSCRFPSHLDKKGYWSLLCRGESVIGQLPEARWKLLEGSREAALRDLNHDYFGSFLENIDQFDPGFFGISPREALWMDPQQRLLLETTYEAINDAGLSHEKLAGSNTGIFTSLYFSQFAQLYTSDAEIDALYLPTGNATSMAANRVSYWLDTHGPSMVIDTACSSSLVAAHLACLHLQNYTCDLAIVSAAHINLLPSINLILSKAKMLSPNGQCKTFDEAANGYVAGEGVGAVILKRLDQALRDQNSIYAVIAGSAVNQDGATNGLTAPNAFQQTTLLNAAYQHAKIDPNEISYIECHGTGTFLGDPIEIEALGEAISQQRTAENPCWIGSVKTTLGHLEPAAGIASIIKVALALQHAKILPQANFSTPNPHIAFEDYHFQIAKELAEWRNHGRYRAAGISGFGFGGTNAHLILRDLNEQEKSASCPIQDIPLPTWQHKTYWPKIQTQYAALRDDATEKSNYPLKSEFIPSSITTQPFQFSFNTHDLPEIRDTFHVLHAGYYLEMLAFAVQTLYQKNHFTLWDVDFLSPILVADDQTIHVQLVLENTDQDIVQFSFYSQEAGKKEWLKNVTGQLLPHMNPDQKIQNIDAIQQRCTTHGDETIFYERIKKMRMPAEGSIHWTQRYWKNEKEILCEFLPPHLVNTNENFFLKIHPGVIDACIQAHFLLLPENYTKAIVASHIEELHYSTEANTHLYLSAYLETTEIIDKKIVSDWILMDPSGKTIAACKNLQMTEIDNPALLEILQALHSTPTSTQTHHATLENVILYLTNQLATILAMPKEEIDRQKPLQNMGVDSLMSMLLVRHIATEFGVTYAPITILQSPSLIEIARDIINKTTIKSPEPSSSPWIFYRQIQPKAKLRLFCFPYGGGGASIYQTWQSQLSNTIEVCPIQLPGRENRLDEASFNQIEPLIEALITHLKPELDLPFALFGHSFGALIVFALARELRKRRLPLPNHLFASAYPDPKTPTTSLDRLLAQLNASHLNLMELNNASAIAKLHEDELNTLFTVFNEQGVVEYHHDAMNQSIMQVLLPIFVADMRIVKSYYHLHEPPFDFPITVFAGKQDGWVLYEDHFGWQSYTNSGFKLHGFNSGHLFIKENFWQHEVLRVIEAAVSTPVILAAS